MARQGERRTSLLAQLLDDYVWFPLPTGPYPDPTPAKGPDPYGNPDPEWLRIDWRDHLRTVELPRPRGAELVNGREGPTRVNYVELGEGEPAVLFVHGLSGSWQNWLENLPHFAKRRRVLALDLPGFGASPMPPWEITIPAFGRVLHDFCEALEVGDCAVVGNSMGGFVSAEAAIAEPGRFEKLALVSAAGITHARVRSQPVETTARMASAVMPLVARVQESMLRRPRVRYATFRGLFHAPHLLRRELIWETFHNGAGRPAFPVAVGALFNYDFLHRLEEIEVPTLIVWGRNDRVVPPNDALGYGERLRNSRTVIFDRTGHLPQVERPVRFNRVLETFLADPA
jgi:pimeloyl-ACP methyl ester carboxylesterase